MKQVRVRTLKNIYWLRDIKAKHGCKDCKDITNPVLLDFDHMDDKSFTISRMIGMSQANLSREVAKCEIVCSNCHRVRTQVRKYKTLELSFPGKAIKSKTAMLNFLDKVKLKAQPCTDCNKTYHYSAMDLDHKDPTMKSGEPSDMTWGARSKFLEELEKCIVLCSNCHRLRTSLHQEWNTELLIAEPVIPQKEDNKMTKEPTSYEVDIWLNDPMNWRDVDDPTEEECQKDQDAFVLARARVLELAARPPVDEYGDADNTYRMIFSFSTEAEAEKFSHDLSDPIIDVFSPNIDVKPIHPEPTEQEIAQLAQDRLDRLPANVREWDTRYWKMTEAELKAYRSGPTEDYIVWDDKLVIQGMVGHRLCMEHAWMFVDTEFFPVGHVVAYKAATPAERKLARKLAKERGYIT